MHTPRTVPEDNSSLIIGNLSLKPNDRAVLLNPNPTARDKHRKTEIIDAIVTIVRSTHIEKGTGVPPGYYATLKTVIRESPDLLATFIDAYMKKDEPACKRIGAIWNDAALELLKRTTELPGYLKPRTSSAIAKLPSQGTEAIDIRTAAVKERFRESFNRDPQEQQPPSSST